MDSTTTTTLTRSPTGAKLIAVQENNYRPGRRGSICDETGKFPTKRDGVSKPTKCLFLAEDGSLKWVGINAGVFPGWWWYRDTSHLVFPPFPTGSWNIGQIRRFENGEVGFTKTLEMPLEGIENAWHPTKIDFTEFELVRQVKDCNSNSGRLWHVKHPRFNKSIFVKIAPFLGCNWSKGVIENETRVYQLVDGLGIAPEFLGHVTYNGAIFGFALELVKGAKNTKKRDKSARIEVVKKLHALGITHGSAHHKNFLKVGKDVLIIDFEEARFGDRATDKLKDEDIRRIGDFKGDMSTWGSMDDEDDYVPDVNKFFDDMVDDEINWTDDSEAGESYD
ncbi:hypothetical protein E0Z10_g6849 [Xylaria hypoxylon]|uniref:Aminoglycoside phosphotransferase domain-containing protein n=1 Tax=Xylaria hypoxylon TaxID=37992 RepID=A0A4Z0YD52_9PEZI|nr:hypothetical protein E0Z10_g6849 [Xylaria hypoxylon]